MGLGVAILLRVRGICAALVLLLLSGCAQRQSSGEEAPAGSVQQAVTGAETKKFAVSLPTSVSIGDAVATGSRSLRLSDRSRTEVASGALSPVYNAGVVAGGVTELGVEARSGTIRSKPAVTLRDRSRVEGDVTSAGSVTRLNSTVVTGAVTQNTAVAFERWSWTVTFPAASQPIVVPNDTSTTLSPGSFEAVVVNPRATLKLRTGSYFLKSLDVESLAKISADTTQGPIFVYVRSGLIWRGTTTFTGPANQLLLGYAAADSVAIESPFQGTIVAPDASVRLAVGATSHIGSVFAKDLLLDPDVRLRQGQFSGWTGIAFDVEPIFECMETREHGTFAARFGYRNPNSSPVTVAVGTGNRFTPGLEDRGQPSTFLPGRHPSAFAVAWKQFQPAWTLSGSPANVNTQQQCAAALQFTPVADATVSSTRSKEALGASVNLQVGAGTHALVGFERRPIKAALGATTQVRRARLELTPQAGSTVGATFAFPMRKIWREETATWNCASDQDTSATDESCLVPNRWKLTRRDGTWDNPWHRVDPHAGTQGAGVVSFDVTADVRKFLGTDWGGAARISWAILSQSGASALFRSKEGGAPPRLIIEPLSETDFDKTQSKLSVVIDASLQPNTASLGTRSDGTVRTVAVVDGGGNKRGEFVQNEVILNNVTPAEAADFKARWNAIDDSRPFVAMPGFGKPYLFRVDLSRANSATLVQNLKEIDSRSTGQFGVSSDAGLRLLALVAQEANQGRSVSANWVAKGTGIDVQAIASGRAVEGPDESGGALGTDPDPSNSLNWGSIVAFGVDRAWETLFFADKLDRKIDVGVLDMGFKKDFLDIASVSDFWSCDAISANGECESLTNCSGNPCPWHGTGVANAGFAEPNNLKGSAGPGGPVSDVSLFFGGGDAYSIQLSLPLLSVDNNIVVTAQQFALPGVFDEIGGNALNAVGDLATLGGEITTLLSRYIFNTLFFASAGNDGEHVDAEDCYAIKEPITEVIAGIFGDVGGGISIEVFCKENKTYFPCEAYGVNCVGGTGADATSVPFAWTQDRYPQSNYGKDLEYFGPYGVLTTSPDANLTPNGFGLAFGTSYSAPYVAGVAALTWAAGFNTSPGDVEDCMTFSALKRGDGIEFRNIVDADAAVRCNLGDARPASRLQIIEPSGDVATLDGPGPMRFRAVAADISGFPINLINWSSTAFNGQSAPGQDFVGGFSAPGEYVVTATAVDRSGAAFSDSVTVSVKPSKPALRVLLPAKNGSTLPFGLPVELLATVENRFPFPDSASFLWAGFVNNSNVFSGTPGQSVFVDFPFAGDAKATVSLTDSGGSGSTSRTFRIFDDGRLHVMILGLPHNQQGEVDVDISAPISLVGRSNRAFTQFQWLAQWGGGPPTVIGSGETLNWTAPIALPNCASLPGTITLLGSAADFDSDSDAVIVNFKAECDVK